MTLIGWIQIVLFCAIVAALARPLGGYMTRVCSASDVSPSSPRSSAPSTALAGIDPDEEQHWLGYALAHARLQPRRLPRCSTRCCACRACCRSTRRACRRVAAGPRLQHRRQLHHQHQLAELRRRDARCRYLTQMAGLTVQNFVSAATGIALAVALIRGFARALGAQRSATSGST